MAKKDEFSLFLEEEKEKWEGFLKNEGIFEEYPVELNSAITRAYINLGKIYLCLHDIERAKWFLKYPTTINVPSSRLEGISNKDDRDLVFSYGEYALKKGIFFDLSNSDLKTADRMFLYASEDFVVPKADVDFWVKHRLYDHIAYGHLWRSYSLIRINRYHEALELLIQVVPYLDRYKKTGVEMWRTVEYALTKALIPLCEYKLDPTEENLASAKKGIEDFIKSLRGKRDKFEAYLYYFHLKEKFADVYEAESVPVAAKPAVKKPVEEKKVEFPVNDEESGEIIVATYDVGFVDIFGTTSDLEKYCAQVKELGDFPNLSSLMEVYVTGSELEPEPLAKECERLLAMDGVNDWIRDRTELMRDTTEDAKETGAYVYLYFNSDNE